MRFKSDDQRKAMFANMNRGHENVNSEIPGTPEKAIHIKGQRGESIAARELYLMANNSPQFYERTKRPLDRAIKKKAIKGEYDGRKVEIAYERRLGDFVRGKEWKQSEGDWKPSKTERKMVARTLRRELEAEMKSEDGLLKRKHPYKDLDDDGVVNKFDCQPMNKKKQGWWHDWQKKRAARQERELSKEEKKLRGELAVEKRKTDLVLKKEQAKKLQAERLESEKRQIRQTKEEITQMKRMRFYSSPAGRAWAKIKAGSAAAVAYEKKHGKSQVRFLKKIGR